MRHPGVGDQRQIGQRRPFPHQPVAIGQRPFQAIQRGLKIMDTTALSLCMDNHLPINVFNMNDEANIDRIISGERVGTLVRPE